MKIFVIISIVFAVCIACCVEGWKKGVRGIALEDGTVKTKASPEEVSAVAFLICTFFSAGYLSTIDYLSFFTWLPYSFALYGVQFLVDVGFVKIALREVFERLYENIGKN